MESWIILLPKLNEILSYELNYINNNKTIAKNNNRINNK